ncbi:MAG: LysM peptidoglycan-binding domain-containing protein [Desulfosarcinaceae bacterium]
MFRILAAKLILESPQDYGFDVKPEQTYPPLAYETVVVDCFDQTPISLVAAAAGSYFKKIKELNPQLRGHYLREGRHELRLPPGGSKQFNDNFNSMVEDYKARRSQYLYIVKSGDSLSGIAAKFDVPLAALLIWNRVGLGKTIHPGDRLIIYPRKLDEIDP